METDTISIGDYSLPDLSGNVIVGNNNINNTQIGNNNQQIVQTPDNSSPQYTPN